jgi:hypothetical protein
MAGYGSFPSGVDLDSYYTYASGSYHDWFLDYHDQLVLSRPELTIRVIPVNKILTELFTSDILADMTIEDRYEDDAPHGQGSLYFLASLVTYAAVVRDMPPSSYTIPSTVHQSIRDNYAEILSTIWQELASFNYSDGTSRVFP